jgi:hypothetical protein
MKKKRKTRIHKRHLKELEASGISEELALKAGIRSVTAKEAKEMVTFNVGPGWAAPYGFPGDDEKIWVVKPDKPYECKDGGTMKYVCPKGQPSRLFFPPGFDEVTHKSDVPIILTEGVKKALCAVEHGYDAVSVHGVWNWQKDTEPIADFKRITWRRRKVYLVFDSDAATNETVRLGLMELALALNQRNAFVTVVSLPPMETGEKMGLDDYLVRHGRESYQDRLEEAGTFVDFEMRRLAEVSDSIRIQEIEMLLKQVAKRCDEIREDEFVEALAKNFKMKKHVLRNTLKKHAKHQVTELDPEEVTVGALNKIRFVQGIDKDERRMRVSKLVLVALRHTGRFLNTEERIFYRPSSSGKIYEMEDPDFAAMCYTRFGTNSSTSEWKFILDELRASTRASEPLVVVRQLAYYATETKTLYVASAGAKMFRLDGKTIEEVVVGTDDIFIRTTGFQPPDLTQTAPDALVKQYLNLYRLNTDTFASIEDVSKLVKVWIWSIFFAELMTARPILCLIGPPRSGKTTLARLLGMILFGPDFQVNIMPENRRDLESLLAGSRLVIIDNNDSRNARAVLDLIATTSTGTDVSRRKYYTTNQLVKFRLSCHLGMTSHTPDFRRGDIADRLLIVPTRHLQQGEIDSRVEQRVLEARGAIWSELLPELNRIVKQLRKTKQPPPIKRFRMAEFADFGNQALETAETDGWERALETMTSGQVAFALHKDHVAIKIRDWLNTQPNGRVDGSPAYGIAMRMYGDKDRAKSYASKIGKTLKDEAHPCRNWFEVTHRHLGGKTLYSLQLTDFGRKMSDVENV